MIDRDKSDPKKFWHIDSLLNRHVSSGIEHVRDPTTNQLLNTKDSAESLNNYYVSITDKLVASLPLTTDDFVPAQLPTRFKFDEIVSVRRVMDSIKDLSPAKASGCLNISSKLYIDALEILSEQITFLINLSIKTQTFPSAWKLAVVTPIPKNGDRCLMSN